jgi:hypothetical protein
MCVRSRPPRSRMQVCLRRIPALAALERTDPRAGGQLRLTLLAPDIQEAILEGRQPKAMQLEDLTDAISSEWDGQRKALLSDAA